MPARQGKHPSEKLWDVIKFFPSDDVIDLEMEGILQGKVV